MLNPCPSSRCGIQSRVLQVQPIILSFLLAVLLFPSCIERRMTLDEAKSVAISMTGEPYTPAPRRIDDITAILDEDPLDETAVRRLEQEADAAPEKGLRGMDLVRFYFDRAMAAKKLGRQEQVLHDLKHAREHLGERTSKTDLAIKVFENLAFQETRFGHIQSGIDRIEEARTVVKDWVGANNVLVYLYGYIGKLEMARDARKRALQMMTHWRGGKGAVWKQYLTAAADGQIQYAEGRYDEAVHSWKKALKASSHRVIEQGYPRLEPHCRGFIAECLMYSGHLAEAEVEARKALRGMIRLFGRRSLDTRWLVEVLGQILTLQGRNQEARVLLERFISEMRDAGIKDDSLAMGWTRFRLGEAYLELGEWDAALNQFERAQKGLGKTEYLFKKFFIMKSSYSLALINTKNHAKAADILNRSYRCSLENHGEDHQHTAEVLGLLGVVHFNMGRTQEALECFSKSVPILMERGEKDGKPLELIFEQYIDLMDHVQGTEMVGTFDIDPVRESFRVAEALRQPSVQRALTKSLTRIGLEDPGMSDLARREQDAEKQIHAFETLLSEHLLLPAQHQDPEVLSRLRSRIKALKAARKVIQEALKSGFPAYQRHLHPPPADPRQVQKKLRQGETFIGLLPSGTKTYIWSIPHQGSIRFTSSDIDKHELRHMVARLRKALDPRPATLGDIPDFDLALSYQLYQNLLEPVKEGWKQAKDLLIVSSGPLGQVPFSVLVTSPPREAGSETLAFSRYREVSWLIQKASITRLPSVSSLISLRKAATKRPERKAFIGFGDPVFSHEQIEEEEAKREDQAAGIASRGGVLHVRGVRVTGEKSLDDPGILSCPLSRLNRLPDTSREIRDIAAALGADAERDAFVGEKASESLVKRMDLSDRKVIAFATHALVPGDLDGLLQPAIALSSPSVTGETNEDGLLMMDEIMSLNLNADWVLLSACNTGAADGKGAEAVSGLGRAFFYAGTRALLVSMWPVETTSAKRITTGIFRFQRDDPALSKARALQTSMLELLHHHLLKDETTGEVVASCAHPLFWAPFIVMGDGT